VADSKLMLICYERKVLLAGWWLVLIWCERKALLADWLTSQANRVNGCTAFLLLIQI